MPCICQELLEVQYISLHCMILLFLWIVLLFCLAIVCQHIFPACWRCISRIMKELQIGWAPHDSDNAWLWTWQCCDGSDNDVNIVNAMAILWNRYRKQLYTLTPNVLEIQSKVCKIACSSTAMQQTGIFGQYHLKEEHLVKMPKIMLPRNHWRATGPRLDPKARVQHLNHQIIDTSAFLWDCGILLWLVCSLLPAGCRPSTSFQVQTSQV